jgi:hypothetical protein
VKLDGPRARRWSGLATAWLCTVGRRLTKFKRAAAPHGAKERTRLWADLMERSQ